MGWYPEARASSSSWARTLVDAFEEGGHFKAEGLLLRTFYVIPVYIVNVLHEHWQHWHVSNTRMSMYLSCTELCRWSAGLPSPTDVIRTLAPGGSPRSDSRPTVKTVVDRGNSSHPHTLRGQLH